MERGRRYAYLAYTRGPCSAPIWSDIEGQAFFSWHPLPYVGIGPSPKSYVGLAQAPNPTR